MAVEILMPALSPSMVAGKLVCWHVAPGTPVKKGDVLAELETDKAALDIESPADGVLERILIEGGTPDVPVQTVIGLIGDGKSAAPPAVAGAAPAPTGQQAAPAPAAPGADEPPRRISPLARRIARDLGVETDGLRGSGPKGRIIAADIREAAVRVAAPAPVAAVAAAAPVAAPPAATPPLTAGTELEPHGAM
ncbi:biotin/lipoyl-containing protein, partial [Pseudogemmobacter blasticus]